MKCQTSHLSDFIRQSEADGKCVFSKQQALAALNVSDNAFLKSANRLAQKSSVAYIKKGLYMIIPNANFHRKTISSESYLDQLMSYLKQPYYVGLLSAAALHGSAHQAPQVFQVITNKQMRPLFSKRQNIKFYYSKSLHLIPTQKIKTRSGYILVSTPEGTAFDLIRYLHQSGHINHVATVLSELTEVLNGRELVKVGKKLSIHHAQRLGFILDFAGHAELTKELCKYVQSHALRYIPLRADAPCKNSEKSTKWHVLINELIDIDDI